MTGPRVRELVGLVILGVTWFLLEVGSTRGRLASSVVMAVATAAYYFGVRTRIPDFFDREWLAKVGVLRAAMFATPLVAAALIAEAVARAL